MSRARVALAWARSLTRSGRAETDVSADAHPRTIGNYRLRDDQVLAVRRVRASFTEFGGALLADPPGAGKTVVALAVAHGERMVLVVAPATLRAQWERSARRAGVPISFVSMESLSRGGAGGDRSPSLMIVDEAHHARTPTTRRYAQLATLCAGARVLLLSATPVVNHGRDRDALLALFLGTSRVLAPAELARCIVRREASLVPGPRIHRVSPIACRALRVADERSIAKGIADLPVPFPTADGAAALALVRITLAFAWSSSLAALDAALRRRSQRGEAIADSLTGGRWPSRATLRQWTLGDDATQLVLPGMAIDATPPPPGAAALLRAHLDAVRALRSVVRPLVERDSQARAAAILRFADSHAGERSVVFARHAETIRALWSRLRSQPGVIGIVGDRVLAAHGRWSREEVLGALGPRAAPLGTGAPSGGHGGIRPIRLLLTTDLLSEGVELQGIGVLIHADRPWTPATLEQREGRIARPNGRSGGSVRTEVVVTRILSPGAAVPLLRLGSRLTAKQRLRQRSVRDADCVALADRAFARSARAPRRAELDDCMGFLAAVRLADRGDAREVVVAGSLREDRWCLSTAPCAIARLAALDVVRLSSAGRDVVTRSIRRALARWARRRSTAAVLGPVSAERSRARSANAWQALHARLSGMLARSSHASRAAFGTAADEAVASLRTSASVGTERALSRLLREDIMDPDAFLERLGRLANTCRRRESTQQERGAGKDARAALVSLILLSGRAFSPSSSVPSPPRPAPPAPSPPPASP